MAKKQAIGVPSLHARPVQGRVVGEAERLTAKVIARNTRVQSRGTVKDTHRDLEVSSPALQTTCRQSPHRAGQARTSRTTASLSLIDRL